MPTDGPEWSPRQDGRSSVRLDTTTPFGVMAGFAAGEAGPSLRAVKQAGAGKVIVDDAPGHRGPEVHR
ncbi:hypothetical protein SCOCK_60154 [Actinacidiphila cocklensis]|uniref:Uncharacterized protein n=1 Tax=Actinacidiphila cocklensis TaxID=887465 RepID=A0A9W4E1P5_9ACTN|nr:hypothetical protein SCOCK_60154 [Actinacidiphila cocklensis]